MKRLFASALAACMAACGGGGVAPTPGVATVTFTPAVKPVTDLVLTAASMNLSHVNIAGDPPPVMMPPAPELNLDLLGTSSVTATLNGYSPGLYSVALFEFHGVMVTGTWDGTPFTVHVEPNMPAVMLRAAMDKELGENENVSFTITVDVASWFANSVLSMATVTASQIVCDGQNNMMVTQQIERNVSHSFGIE